MCTYPLQQNKHKHKGSFSTFSALHLYIFATTTHHYQNAKYCMCKYLSNNINIYIEDSFTNCRVFLIYIPSTTTQTYTQCIFAKMTSLICVHNFYNNININTKACCQNDQSHMCTYLLQKHTKLCWKNDQSYMCTYSLQQNKQEHKGFLSKIPLLHLYILTNTKNTHTYKVSLSKCPVLHVYILSATTQK